MTHSYNAIKEYASLRVGSAKREVVSVGNALTLTAAHSGNLMLLNSTNGSTITIPTAAGNAGLVFDLVVSATSAGHIITGGGAASMIGAVPVALSTAGVVISSTGGATLSTTVGSAVGDRFSLVCTGSKWLISGAASRFNGAIFA